MPSQLEHAVRLLGAHAARPRFREIATKVQARLNCLKSNNHEWLAKHEAWLLDEARNGPSGAGIDGGTKIDLDATTEEKLVFNCSYHHMNDVGMYNGWTEHQIIVKPSLVYGYTLRITGPDRNDIKQYLDEVYDFWLSQEIAIS